MKDSIKYKTKYLNTNGHRNGKKTFLDISFAAQRFKVQLLVPCFYLISKAQLLVCFRKQPLPPN